jgi:predicted acyltransferase
VIFGFLGPGVIAYLVAWLVVPSDDGQAVVPGTPRSGQAGAYLAGVVLVAAGTAWAIDLAVPGLAKVLWPAVLVAAGVALLTGVRR